jgi:hypothetical protein
MTNKRQVRRMLVAGTLSIMLNGILIFLITSVEPEQHRSSIIVKITDALGSPGTGLANWLVPSGHDVAHFLGGAAVAVTSSILFYALLIWVILSLPSWWRDRA